MKYKGIRDWLSAQFRSLRTSNFNTSNFIIPNGGLSCYYPISGLSKSWKRATLSLSRSSRRQLGTNSYDVRLGEWFFLPNHNMVTVNFTDEADARAFWGDPHRAREWR